ncbi:hypothetical protein Lbru_3027 [Legionella brunensis]|uniref:Uncharacterized protein n=1 Tax=Legionella brunensis TaxID=29422 RepID=A0A0W0S0U0_9GAMM|nr:hypothetical protein Lbru_3027 [Legionella brunensis]
MNTYSNPSNNLLSTKILAKWTVVLVLLIFNVLKSHFGMQFAKLTVKQKNGIGG